MSKKHRKDSLMYVIEDVQTDKADELRKDEELEKDADEGTPIKTSAKTDDSEVKEETEASEKDDDQKEVKEDASEEDDEDGEKEVKEESDEDLDATKVKEEMGEEEGDDVSPKQKMVDEVMKKLTQMDEEELSGLHGQIVKATGPAETEMGLADVAAGVAKAPKATAPVAKGGTTSSEIAEDDSDSKESDEDGEKDIKEEDEADKSEDDKEVKEDKSEDEEEEDDKDEVKEEAGDKNASEDDDKESDEVKEESDEDAKDEKELDVSEDIKVLLAADKNLTEGFKTKAKTLFEAALSTRVRKEKNKLQEAYATKLTKNTKAVATKLSEQVDSYLTYVTETWMKENKVAIDQSLRVEVTENFISSMKNLFSEHYIEVPASKKNVVQDLSGKNVKLQEQYLGAQKTIATLRQMNEKLQRKAILEAASRGLASTQAVRLTELAKDVKFESSETFQKKVATIRESYFGSSKKVTSPAKSTSGSIRPVNEKTTTTEVIVEGTSADAAVSLDMQKYVNAISRAEHNNPNRKV